MRSYGQYCPMAKAAEILADRWTLLIVRDLLLGVAHFNALERGLPGIPRALLAQRLRRLERAGVVERRVAGNGRATEYHLTPAGRELRRLVDVLVEWGARWGRSATRTQPTWTRSCSCGGCGGASTTTVSRRSRLWWSSTSGARAPGLCGCSSTAATCPSASSTPASTPTSW